ncbi:MULTISPECIES: DUF6325 family protein [unclassified Microbacterium]|uniref:DUF6325 family protein n=1 Tax=unclassified Microbacterium TaxID=2609290 RepID=UPI000C2B55D9|nr:MULTISPECIES: DUF6325 family protein [unclassified Microbacterium]
MVAFAYGPVELYLVGLEDERPAPGVVDALAEVLDAGLVRLLDLVLMSRDDDGNLTVVEIEEETDDYGFGGVELAAVGIVGDEDIAELSELVEPGTSAVLVALELAWARRLSEKLAASGGQLLSVERIPAPVVNALIESIDED